MTYLIIINNYVDHEIIANHGVSDSRIRSSSTLWESERMGVLYARKGERERRGFKTCPPICHSCVNAEGRGNGGEGGLTEKKGAKRKELSM